MYVPRHFAPPHDAALRALVRDHPLAALVVLGPDGLRASEVPLLLDPGPAPHGVLRGHVARANPVWRELAPDAPALAVFRGSEAYVSPSWYATKRETGKVVPTWNYVTVHAHGALRAVDDRDWLREQIEALTDQQEQALGRAGPWRVSDAPPDYVEKMLGAIVGLELRIERVEGSWKLSQNRSERDRDGVVEGLLAVGTEAAATVARLVRDAERS